MDSFSGKRILVTGATGLIGYSLVNSLMKFTNVHVIAVSRSESKLQKCFSKYKHNLKKKNIKYVLLWNYLSPLFSFFLFPILMILLN